MSFIHSLTQLEVEVLCPRELTTTPTLTLQPIKWIRSWHGAWFIQADIFITFSIDVLSKVMIRRLTKLKWKTFIT